MSDSEISILYLEDNPMDVELVETVLGRELAAVSVLSVETREEYLAALAERAFDVILVDYALPAFDGLSALASAKETQPHVPVIVLSGAIGEETAIETLKQGATDYVLKDRLPRLPAAVRRALKEANEQARSREAEKRILASLEEKEVMLREIHHRVKNNLQMVSSLLDLQCESQDDRRVTAALKDAQRRVRSMALIHESLYRSSNLAKLSMRQYVHDLVDHLMHTVGRLGVEVEVEVDELHMSVDEAIPCGLIINELVSNAVEHGLAGREGGRIAVALRREGAELALRVTDDGVGLPPTMADNTLGLHLVRTLTRQLRGTLSMDGPPGASFTIKFAVD